MEKTDLELREQGTQRISAGEERTTDQRMDGGRTKHPTDTPDTGRNQGLSGHSRTGTLAGPERTPGLRMVYRRKLAGGLCRNEPTVRKENKIPQQVIDVPPGEPGETAAGI